MKKVAIASDHAGFRLKEAMKKHFSGQYEWVDLGTDSEESVDYPEFGKAMADALERGDAETGVLICGSGIGISIAANRFAHVRAALCTKPEMAALSRQHNDANVIALGERITDFDTAFRCVETFMETPFEGGRHQRRVDLLGHEGTKAKERA